MVLLVRSTVSGNRGLSDNNAGGASYNPLSDPPAPALLTLAPYLLGNLGAGARLGHSKVCRSPGVQEIDLLPRGSPEPGMAVTSNATTTRRRAAAAATGGSARSSEGRNNWRTGSAGGPSVATRTWRCRFCQALAQRVKGRGGGRDTERGRRLVVFPGACPVRRGATRTYACIGTSRATPSAGTWTSP